MIPIGGSSTRILVVDDRESVRESLRARIALSSPQDTVTTAESGKQALLRLSHETFDVVLCDLRLKGDLDGIAVTRQISQSHPQVRVVVFSGQDEGQSKIEVLQAGAFAYLSKPINHDELLHAIKTINSIRRTEKLSQWFQQLARISYDLQSSFDEDYLADRIVAGACELGYSRARLYLFDRESKSLVGKAARGLPPNFRFVGYPIPLAASSIVRYLFERDRPTFCNEDSLKERFGPEGTLPWLSDLELQGVTWIDCPLLVGNRRIGTLAVDHGGRTDRSLTQEDREIMGVFSGLAAQALYNSRLYAKEALAKASLLSILRDAPDMVVTTDLTGKINFVSPSSERILGYRPAEMIGRPATDFYADEAGAPTGSPSGSPTVSPDTARAVARDIMQKLHTLGMISNYKVYLRGPDGGVHPISLSGSLLRDEHGVAIGTLGFLKDLSPLEAQTQQYRDVLEGFGHGTLLLSENGSIGFINRKAARLLRWRRAELVGTKFVDMILPAQRPDFTAGFTKVLQEGCEVSLDLSIVQRDQHRISIKVTLTPIKSPHSLRGVALAFHDKSELAALISSGRLMALGQLIAGVAHEINNPLNNILLAARELENDLPPESSAQEYLEMVQRNGRRIRDTVQQLREFARPSEFNRQWVDLNSVIRDALRFFARRFRSNNIVLAEELAVDLPQIFADAPRLQQVIVNLIVNAEDAMEEQEEPKEVRVESFAVAADQVGLLISDSGCGIPDEIKEAIFDPFFTTKPPNRGTGLGLSISKSIVEMHGGSILVEPNPQGRGSQFRIVLPVLATDAPNANHDPESGTS